MRAWYCHQEYVGMETFKSIDHREAVYKSIPRFDETDRACYMKRCKKKLCILCTTGSAPHRTSSKLASCRVSMTVRRIPFCDNSSRFFGSIYLRMSFPSRQHSVAGNSSLVARVVQQQQQQQSAIFSCLAWQQMNEESREEKRG